MTKKNDISYQISDFSLVTGGALYQLYLRMHLLKPPVNFVGRRMLVMALLTWFPLLILSAWNHTAIGNVQVPFLYDLATHARFLIALMLLIAADATVHHRIHFFIEQFITRNIITPEHRKAFNNIITSCLRLRNSFVAELGLIVFVVVVGHWIWKEFSLLQVATWYTKLTGQGSALEPAGYWYTFISLPIFQFILLRWYYRLFIWYQFLWKVSKLPLRLNSLHPDKAGGIGFLGNSVFAFSPILIAHTVLLAGVIATRIWHVDATLPEFKLEIFGIILYLLIIIFTPMLFFSVKMLQEKRVGTLEYGVTASRYVDQFKNKWVQASPKNHEAILGTPDIQSLADLSNSFNVSSEMRLTPFSRGTVMKMIILTAIPLLPLLLTLMPLEEMINSLVKVIF